MNKIILSVLGLLSVSVAAMAAEPFQESSLPNNGQAAECREAPVAVPAEIQVNPIVPPKPAGSLEALQFQLFQETAAFDTGEGDLDAYLPMPPQTPALPSSGIELQPMVFVVG